MTATEIIARAKPLPPEQRLDVTRQTEDTVTVSDAGDESAWVTRNPRTDGPLWKAAEAEGHDMTIVACLLRLPVIERLKIHRASLATVDMLRSAVLTNE